ncbi:histone-lysine N-methyltransferase SETDB1-B-like [Nerophis ophidion]|uniref:histone-lysine N-methyltransferase SETDB1-B-like n=1 Tax=Nerophis ophidion TaxID=159077 RepID=UPI002ADFBD1A|nr:histone-lysine N-methyltransferase SETDB1-B-like [Nerophis ophidion]XP_061738149.1 histone-lysine N-methyltransferase SETDB1-B-like [Nerophis ophidion]XP_061738150.1 histone-lysine N-methyltransferase SETDB1-B-like [Nerophis ophidion]
MKMEDQLEMMSQFQEPRAKRKMMAIENMPESGPSTSGFPYDRAHLKYGLSKRVEVSLFRLPEYKISALRPPTPPQFYSEDESVSSSNSGLHDRQEDSSDSDYSSSKTPKAKANSLEHTPIIDSSVFAYTPQETLKSRPELPEEEIKVDMVVLAKKKNLRWHRGQIVEVVIKEDGRLKYKVIFEEKGKSLVSGHHIAFETMPKLEQLYVGARVVVKCQDDATLFRAGILAELPCRKNRLRFLVFLDNHKPIYVGLTLFHLVCRPLPEPVEDIQDEAHRSFMAQYLRDWPYPHLTQYKPGQTASVEFNDEYHKCKVELVDSSLIQVLFKFDQHKEWIHRGSIRLEHMPRFLELRRREADGGEN